MKDFQLRNFIIFRQTLLQTGYLAKVEKKFPDTKKVSDHLIWSQKGYE